MMRRLLRIFLCVLVAVVVLAGELEGVSLAEGWAARPGGDAARRAFRIGGEEAALVIVDAEGFGAVTE